MGGASRPCPAFVALGSAYQPFWRTSTTPSTRRTAVHSRSAHAHSPRSDERTAARVGRSYRTASTAGGSRDVERAENVRGCTAMCSTAAHLRRVCITLSDDRCEYTLYAVCPPPRGQTRVTCSKRTLGRIKINMNVLPPPKLHTYRVSCPRLSRPTRALCIREAELVPECAPVHQSYWLGAIQFAYASALAVSSLRDAIQVLRLTFPTIQFKESES